MADAVAYLSRVARDAGLQDISADLLTIRERLVREAERRRMRGARKIVPAAKAR